MDVQPAAGGRGPGQKLSECPSNKSCFSPQAPKRRGYLAPWSFSGKASGASAMAEVREAVDAYPPGQRGVDGGGFEVKEADMAKGYLYVQFESLRYGYIDDVEFVLEAPKAAGGAGRVLVRSASRMGAADFGVNALRLNRLAADLRKRGGWDAPDITRETHPEYWEANCKLPGVGSLPECAA